MWRDEVGQRPPLEVFRRAYMAANEAFNEHDFERAFSGFQPDLEWRTVADVPGPKVFYGREGVIRAFRQLLAEFPDWRVEPQDVIEGGPDSILVCNIATATGSESRVPVHQRFTQVWTFRDGRPVSVHKYFEHRDALEAVGLRE